MKIDLGFTDPQLLLVSGTVCNSVDLLYVQLLWGQKVVGSNPTPARIVVGVFILGMQSKDFSHKTLGRDRNNPSKFPQNHTSAP